MRNIGDKDKLTVKEISRSMLISAEEVISIYKEIVEFES